MQVNDERPPASGSGSSVTGAAETVREYQAPGGAEGRPESAVAPQRAPTQTDGKLDGGNGEPVRDEERATPMTLISSAPRWWARTTWLLGRWNSWRLRRWDGFYPFDELIRLSFIHFAHWSILKRMPPNDPNGRRLPHPYVVFQTNFNRGWREYIEAFCYVVPWGVRGNWWGCYGFPPTQPVSRFLDYVDARFTRHLHFYCSYPDASTRMVLAALYERERFNDFAAANHVPPPRLRRTGVEAPRGGSLSDIRRERADTISVIAPITEHHEDELRNLICALPKGPQSPLARVEGTHMARWSIVSPLPHKDTGQTIDCTSYLLFTSWFIGNTSAYLRALRLGLGPLADDIWGHCVGYPGKRDLEQFWAFMDAHCLKPHLAFAGYKHSVTQVRAGLQLCEELSPTVAKCSGMDAVALEREWRKKHEQSVDQAVLERLEQELVGRY